MEVELREVSELDLKRIYEWRNHPITRKNSFNSDEINWEEHEKYWKEKLKCKACHSFIIVFEKRDCGILRLEKKGDSCEVNIAVDPAMHGRGIGSAAISKAKEFAKKAGLHSLFARVKPANPSSMAIFKKNGFEHRHNVLELFL